MLDEDEYLDPSLLTEATLPISNISRLMKKALPRQAKVSSSAKDLIQACCIEFISFLTSEANEKCLAEKRKTINGDDILFAMKMLGFEEYEIVCRIWLTRYRMVCTFPLFFSSHTPLGPGNGQQKTWVASAAFHETRTFFQRRCGSGSLIDLYST